MNEGKGKVNRTRPHQVIVRMNDSEFEDFKEKIKTSGISQQSYLLKSIKSGKISSSEEISELKGISGDFDIFIRQVRGLASNVNQMTRLAHVNRDIPEEAELKRISAILMRYWQEGERIWQSIRSSIGQ